MHGGLKEIETDRILCEATNLIRRVMKGLVAENDLRRRLRPGHVCRETVKLLGS